MILKIKVEKTEQIEHALDAVQQKSRVRCISHADINNIVSQIEKSLKSKNIPKKDWNGLRFKCNAHAQHFAKAYKFTPESTIIVLEYIGKCWYLMQVDRMPCTNTYIEVLSSAFERYKELIKKYISHVIA